METVQALKIRVTSRMMFLFVPKWLLWMGETIFGFDTLGGVYESEGVEDPDIHGYFPQMLFTALEGLHVELVGKTVASSRKSWDPREAEVDPERRELAMEVRAAVMFVQRSMEEIHNREQRRA